MKAQKYAVNQYLIESVLSKVREDEIAIPEIQRPFEKVPSDSMKYNHF